ncbi:unnamed protein product [Spirodela intermedia]|uniref:Uncharacterized protein n=1 Tax=Spirodela intermedia TaxID=51605 RepID=A0A7I8J4P3_SPIIN|nr:unnamed protein product [Spirodela intermedia]CAA6664351.1 unnamed protein product [Spirodela intermedia]
MSRVVSEDLGVFSPASGPWFPGFLKLRPTTNLSHFEDKTNSNSSSHMRYAISSSSSFLLPPHLGAFFHRKNIDIFFQSLRDNTLPQLIENVSAADACDSTAVASNPSAPSSEMSFITLLVFRPNDERNSEVPMGYTFSFFSSLNYEVTICFINENLSVAIYLQLCALLVARWYLLLYVSLHLSLPGNGSVYFFNKAEEKIGLTSAVRQCFHEGKEG